MLLFHYGKPTEFTTRAKAAFGATQTVGYDAVSILPTGNAHGSQPAGTNATEQQLSTETISSVHNAERPRFCGALFVRWRRRLVAAVGVVHQHHTPHTRHVQFSTPQGAQTRINIGHFARHGKHGKLNTVYFVELRRPLSSKSGFPRLARQEQSSSAWLASKCPSLAASHCLFITLLCTIFLTASHRESHTSFVVVERLIPPLSHR